MASWTQDPPVNTHLERQILTGFIISDRVLRELSLIYKQKYLSADFAREVAKWCLEYQTKYNRAPRADIQTLFEAHRLSGMDEDLARLIAHLLSSISQEYEKEEQFNDQLCIDIAIDYFRRQSLDLLKNDLDYFLEGGNLNAATAAIAEFNSPNGSISLGFDPFGEPEAFQRAFSERNKLFTLPGDLGSQINLLERDNAVAVIGKYKGAKSFTSQYIALQGYYSGLDIAWFDFEMGKTRIIKRLAQAICAMPLTLPNDGKIKIPVWDCYNNQTGTCSRAERTCRVSLFGESGKPKFENAPHGYVACDACPDKKIDSWFVEKKIDLLSWRTAWSKAQAVAGSVMGAKIKIQSWPKFSAGINDVLATLQVWRHLEGFNPGLIIVDQPSGMKMIGKGDFRHQVDDLWKRLCALPQELHCLGIFPCQAGGKDAQERRRLRDSDVAEHSGILGHVDGSIKIDQDDDDKAAKRAIFSMGVERDDDSPEKYCMVLQALALGQPVLDSRFI
jgi:hypothetical protein